MTTTMTTTMTSITPFMCYRQHSLRPLLFACAHTIDWC